MGKYMISLLHSENMRVEMKHLWNFVEKSELRSLLSNMERTKKQKDSSNLLSYERLNKESNAVFIFPLVFK